MSSVASISFDFLTHRPTHHAKRRNLRILGFLLFRQILRFLTPPPTTSTVISSFASISCHFLTHLPTLHAKRRNPRILRFLQFRRILRFLTPPPIPWVRSLVFYHLLILSHILACGLYCRTLSLATLTSQHRILRLYLFNTGVRSVSCDFNYLTLCFYVMWGLTTEIITRWGGESPQKFVRDGGESPQMSLLSFLSCIATRLLETWSHGKGIPLETETLNLHS